MARFVILEHDHPFFHWDLLLENGESLKSWRVRQNLLVQHVQIIERLADHRIIYLDYEGPVSGNRGTVLRWDEGELIRFDRQQESLCVELKGNKIAGAIRIDLPEQPFATLIYQPNTRC